jgi:hypothetical protein
MLGLVCRIFTGTFAAAQEHRKLSPEDCASWIDQQFEAAWKQAGIEPAPATVDTEFVRRVYLDLIGRTPSVAEVREFLEDTRPDKRSQLVAKLLQHGAFAAHLANTWRDLLLAGSTAPEARAQATASETWLKLRFSANMPYDQIVHDLLTATLDQTSPRAPSPLAFYQAAEFKPEQLAANVSRVFLGVQVQCAECHDHPFAAWKQPQFWSFAAFFNKLDGQRDAGTLLAANEDWDEISIPGKDIAVPALFLDGQKPEPVPGIGKRSTLARWITGPDNPYFTRAVVNRVWGSFFGRGFVQPVDDIDPANPVAHPEVFDELCAQLRLHQYDLKYLVRVITATRVYQLSSRGEPLEKDDPASVHFARMPLRRMTSDQIYASFLQATGYRDAAANRQNVVALANTARDEFLTKFGDSAVSPTEIETTILQALSLMNGRFVTQTTDLEQSDLLSIVAEAPFLSDAERIEVLFLSVLSRPPTAEEISLFLGEGSSDDVTVRKTQLADTLWTLLNSAEFLLNH